MNAPIDTLWVLISAALVFIMQPGFMCLESGLTRSKNSINVAIKNFADFCFSTCGYWAVGYGIMFGASWAGVLGVDEFLVSLDESEFTVAFFLFQVMFCGTATTIFSGAVAERMRFSSYIIIAAFVAVLIYPLFGHWAWAGLDTGNMAGLLGRSGFADFAGSTVVHSVGGWVALAALLIIGPRTGRFPNDGPPREINASNVPLSVLGVFLLWVGWLGFNGGSTLAMNASVPGILAKTTLAASAGAMSCLMIGWRASGVPKILYLINGSLGGLVAITANCHAVSALSAVVIGVVAGLVCLVTEHLLLRFRIDDAVGAIPVHLGCGVWGTLAVAFFGDPVALGTGLSFGQQLLIQAEGVLAAFAVAFGIPYLFMKGLDRISPMRVTGEEEEMGLNVSEHGAKTELADLFEVMQKQAATSDLSLRVPEEPFTEVGSIARMYNRVIAALEQAMAHTEAIVATSADAIISFARDTLEIMTINPSAERMFGLSAALPAGTVMTTLFVERDSGRQISARGMVELTGRHANGGCFPLEAAVSEVKLGPEGVMVGLFRDISFRKVAENKLREAEAKYRGIFENAVEGIFQTTPEGRYLTVNPALVAMYGFESPQEMLDHFTDLKTQLYVNETQRDDFVELMQRKGRVEQYESQMYRKDGSVLWTSRNARAVRDASGAIIRYEGHVIDITERKRAELALRMEQKKTTAMNRELSEAYARLQELDQLKTDFLSMVSHELRTPLTSIIGFAEISRNDLLAKVFPLLGNTEKKVTRAMDNVESSLMIILQEGERLTTLINNVLDSSKMEAGKVDWKSDSLQMEDIIRRALASTRSLFEQKGLELVLECPDNLPSIRGDGDRLIQVMVNLISNAVKFTREGAITCRAVEEDGGVRVSVIDTGVGISAHEKGQVFEKFKQVGDTLTDKPAGTGLGLPICKQIIEHHDGAIGVESTPGKGSEFWFTLPGEAAAREASRRAIKTFAEINGATFFQSFARRLGLDSDVPPERPGVLLAVEDSDARGQLRAHCEALGMDPHESGVLNEALEIAQRTPLAGAILDLGGQNDRNLDLAAFLRKHRRTRDCTIMVCGLGDDFESGRTLALDRLFPRPIGRDMFLKELRLLMKEAASLDSIRADTGQVLVADENSNLAQTFASVISDQGLAAHIASTPEDCIEAALRDRPAVLVVGARFAMQAGILKTLRFKKDMHGIRAILLS